MHRIDITGGALGVQKQTFRRYSKAEPGSAIILCKSELDMSKETVERRCHNHIKTNYAGATQGFRLVQTESAESHCER